MSNLAITVDSLQRVIIHQDSMLAVALAHGDTLTMKIVDVTPHSQGGAIARLLDQFGGGMIVPVTVAVMVFVATQALAKLIIDPTLELRRVIGRVAHALVFYADVHANPGVLAPARMDEAQNAYRDLSSELRAAVASVPPWGIGLLSRWRIVPPWNNILSAARHLIGLSNGIHASSAPGINVPVLNMDRADKIRSCLGIPPLD